MPLGALLQSQRFGELDHLACGEAEVRRPGARVDVHLNFVELATSRGIQAPASNQSQSGKLGFLSEINVLAHREVHQKRLFLEYDSYAIEIGIAGAPEENRRAIQFQRSAVWRIDAGEDPHQRRLACAVLANQADHFVDAYLHIDIV